MNLTVYSYHFDQRSSFSFVFTTESADPFGSLIGLRDAILYHFGPADLVFGPGSLQRPSLRLGAGPYIKHFHQIEEPSPARAGARIWQFN